MARTHTAIVLIQTMKRALLDNVLLELDSEDASLLVPEEVEGPESGYGEIRQGAVTYRPKYRRYKR